MLLLSSPCVLVCSVCVATGYSSLDDSPDMLLAISLIFVASTQQEPMIMVLLL